MPDRRAAVRAAMGVFFPFGIGMLIGVPATIADLAAVALIAKPWATHLRPGAIALLVFLALAFPVAYFVLGFQYGTARAVFHVYSVYRERVAELVIAHLTDMPDPGAGRRGLRAWVDRGSQAMRDVPPAVRRAIKIILMIAGAGDRLQDVVGQARMGVRPEVDVVAAILDDALLARSVEPLRWALIAVAALNVAGLVALHYLVR